jgi:aminoglycoside 2'-N-acetyltransferase I
VLAYYRCAWAVQDIAAYGEQVLLAPALGEETRRAAVEGFMTCSSRATSSTWRGHRMRAARRSPEPPAGRPVALARSLAPSSGMVRLREVTSAALSTGELDALRRLLDQAFHGGFGEDDWHHTVGGSHLLALEEGEPVAHAAVVDRTLSAGGRQLRTGYVEGVATRSDRHRQGLATLVMRAANRLIERRYELGALSDGTGIPGFYERLGWERWRGPTFVATARGPLRTADDDDSVMVLRTPTTGALDLAAPLVCDWRPGDAW